ncbi:hypothetical protein K4F52_002273 [Lecanicillium sp. MT-2017a]|nr:hypothetical protein K4F52_002273 [Lecanicillium sp. MT-2017a]
MPRSYDDDDDYARHPRRGRDRSPDYYSGGSNRHDTGGPPLRAAAPDFRDDEPFQREEMTLMPPANQPRGGSMPPYNSANALAYRDRSPSPDRYSRSRRGRSRSSSASSRRSRGHGGGNESPLSRARSVMEDNFTHSTRGIGASVLGAVVGGFVANKASGAAFGDKDKGRRHHGKHHQRRHSAGGDHNVPQAVSTLLGAVAGGLGANAIAHRVEESRDRKNSRHQIGWDGGSRRSYDDYDDDYRYDDRRYDDRRYGDGRYDDGYDDARYNDARYRRHRDAEEYR